MCTEAGNAAATHARPVGAAPQTALPPPAQLAGAPVAPAMAAAAAADAVDDAVDAAAAAVDAAVDADVAPAGADEAGAAVAANVGACNPDGDGATGPGRTRARTDQRSPPAGS